MFVKWSFSFNDRVMDRPAREAIRMIDEISSETHYLFDKFPQHQNEIDSEARN